MPIYMAKIGTGELRFFASQSPDDPRPWHSQDDLLFCMGLPRALRRRFQAMNKQREFAGQWTTAKTPDGVTTIAAHDMALGLMAAVARANGIAPTFQASYAQAFAKANSPAA
jgi:hypothetical protein